MYTGFRQVMQNLQNLQNGSILRKVMQTVRQNKFSDKSHAKGHAKNIFDSAKIIEIKQFDALQVMKFGYFL